MTSPSPAFRRCSFYPESLLRLAFFLSFWRIKVMSAISGSTESRLTGRSVPLFGLVRLRLVGPLQKLRWREPGSLPVPTQSSQRLSHLDVTQLSGIMRFPSHYTQKGSTRQPQHLDPGPFSPILSGTPNAYYILPSLDPLSIIRKTHEHEAG